MSLPGFSVFKDEKLPYLKALLKKAKEVLKIDFSRVSVQDYIDAGKNIEKR